MDVYIYICFLILGQIGLVWGSIRRKTVGGHRRERWEEWENGDGPAIHSPFSILSPTLGYGDRGIFRIA